MFERSVELVILWLGLYTSDTRLAELLYISIEAMCYDSMLKVLSKELPLILSDTRELDRVPNTK